jgi:hypothetical protein
VSIHKNEESAPAAIIKTATDIRALALEDFYPSYDSVFRSIPIGDVLEFAKYPGSATRVLPSDFTSTMTSSGFACIFTKDENGQIIDIEMLPNSMTSTSHSEFTVVTKESTGKDENNRGVQVWLEMTVDEDAIGRFLSNNSSYCYEHFCEIYTVIFTMGKPISSGFKGPCLSFHPDIIDLQEKNYDATCRRLEKKAKAGRKVNILEIVLLPLIGTKAPAFEKAQKACSLILLCEKDPEKRKKYGAALAMAAGKVLNESEQEAMKTEMRKLGLLEE